MTDPCLSLLVTGYAPVPSSILIPTQWTSSPLQRCIVALLWYRACGEVTTGTQANRPATLLANTAFFGRTLTDKPCSSSVSLFPHAKALTYQLPLSFCIFQICSLQNPGVLGQIDPSSTNNFVKMIPTICKP